MIDQIAIASTSVVAIYLSQSREASKRKWASVFGCAGQPFWFYAMYTSEQWGVFVLCFFYTFAWARGFYIHWINTGKSDDNTQV